MHEEPNPVPTPTGYQRTQGGGVKWVPPTAEHLSSLLPQYDVEALVGRGGMGAVYKGKQKSLDRLVAIKILPPNVDDEDATYTERFKNEARVMAKLTHPAIVAVYDFGETSEGQFYFVMEFVDGTDVEKMIVQQGKLPSQHALAVTMHVCDALKYAHEHGVIHRDIKPSNVLINGEGAVKVADFGLAKLDEAGANGLTQSGMALGTPDFVAPEALIMGINVDARADLYAVGVMLYNMLTGNVPRGAFKPASRLIPGLDPRFDAIATKAMQHEREERYQSAAGIRQDLDAILTSPRVQPGPHTGATAPGQPIGQKPMATGPHHPKKPMATGPHQPRQKPTFTGPHQPRQKPTATGPHQPKQTLTATGPHQPKEKAAVTPQPNQEFQKAGPKSKKPLFIGIGAGTVVALGAFFMWPGKPAAGSGGTRTVSKAQIPYTPIKVRENPKAMPGSLGSTQKPGTSKSSTTKNDGLKPSAVLASSTGSKTSPATSTSKDSSKPAAMAAAKPIISQTPAASSTTPKPGPKPARLPDPAKWVPAFETRTSLPPGANAEWTDQGIHLKATIHLPSSLATDGAVRAKIRPGAKSTNLGLRNTGTDAILAGVEAEKNLVLLDRKRGQEFVHLGKFSYAPPPSTQKEILLEFVAVGKVLQISVDGRVIGSLMDDDEPVGGKFSAYSTDGYVRDLAWQSLDQPVVATIAPSPPAPAPPPAPVEPPKTETNDPIAQRLEQISAQFRVAFNRDIAPGHNAAAATLDAKYLAALNRSLEAATQVANLDEAVKLREERERVTQKGALPPLDLDSLPASLKGLRGTYRVALAKLEQERDAKAKPYYDRFDQLLAAFQAELTQQKRIDDALKVKARRDEVQEARTNSGTDSSASAAIFNAPQASAAKPADPAVHRSVAEWVLGYGGFVEVETRGGKQTIRDIADLPEETFALTGVNLGGPLGKRVSEKQFAQIGLIGSLRFVDLGEGPQAGSLKSMAGLTELRALTMAGQRIFEEKDMSHLARLTKLENLSLYLIAPTGESCEHLAGASGLKSLNLGGSGNLTMKGARAIASLKSLRTLTLNKWLDKRNQDTLQPIATLPELTSLYLDNCILTPEGFAHLAGLKKIQKLNLVGATIDNRGFAFLAPCAGTLKELYHQGSGINDEGIRHIVANLQNLESFTLSPQASCTTASLKEMAKLPKLKSLAWTARENMKDADWLLLRELPALEVLGLSGSAVSDTALQPLAAIKKLRELKLGNAQNSKVTESGVAEFKSARPDVIITR